MFRILKYAAFVAVLIGATAITTMSVVNLSQARNVDIQESEPEVIIDPIFFEFQPFTVTLYGEKRNRILYTSITLRLENESSLEQINTYMPEARDRILRTLSTLNEKNVKTADDRENLAEQIKINLSQPYSEQLQKPLIMDVLFTAFVVQ